MTSVRTSRVALPIWNDESTFGAGLGFTCGIVGGGTLYCAGANERGELGDGTGVSSPTPRRIELLTRVEVRASAVASGRGCVILTDGFLWCWGDNALGQLGGSAATRQLAPALVMR
jgi:alpha-tubulin suppressor-like RCC1 family protein